MDAKINLEAVSWNEEPTPTQMFNALKGMEDFLSKTSGALLLAGTYSCADPSMVALLNATVTLRLARNGFDMQMGGQVVQQIGRPQMVPRS